VRPNPPQDQREEDYFDEDEFPGGAGEGLRVEGDEPTAMVCLSEGT